jgi:DNA-binding transcriptional regulator YhcF (GntR family)
MDIAIRIEGRHDLTGQIYRQLRAAIVDGRAAAGTRLPSTHDLAVLVSAINGWNRLAIAFRKLPE